jgi:hypothetical protein
MSTRMTMHQLRITQPTVSMTLAGAEVLAFSRAFSRPSEALDERLGALSSLRRGRV